MNCFATKYTKKKENMNNPVWPEMIASPLKQPDWAVNLTALMVEK